jgi:hypothetical protein
MESSYLKYLLAVPIKNLEIYIEELVATRCQNSDKYCLLFSHGSSAQKKTHKDTT